MRTKKADGVGPAVTGNVVPPDGLARGAGAALPAGAGIDEVRADIDRTRERLAETVAALAAKADVKARARAATATARNRVRRAAADGVDRVASTARRVGSAVRRRPVPVAVVAAGLALAVVAVIRRRGADARRSGALWR